MEIKPLLYSEQINAAIKSLIEQHLYTAQDLGIESVQASSTTDNLEATENNEGDTQKSK
jgi:hypothetical protein